ncbi:putative 2-succinyl-6-hydroxy-2,4-cyclohexadiene-1-carboxylate synthase [Ktedonobacter sp. SOSP1-52]|uniref:2-succinyl-6-hydroxy-2, 4-cyclohexadiene-1-carboxylate synthase n=1 Tax=Ktedonobacter sp. SOSP1-52 TaxID=2778366 RepID=UPI001916204D|nr:2-succinyl-6-hydroxy-2,4-cyclohexadiene-1-carboxylate synthase [Ktedonobacter sp. SOSP1-52]GHO66057.1 putative 2-succinyl-6-hydroxy-2,4-cyclohexadiene-1-carboxylate synthase [Ktedonobacter sp. SOSP1-52]
MGSTLRIMSLRQLAVDGVHMGAVIYGKPQHPPLVLLHGFTGSALSWSPLFASLSSYNVKLIALDMLGHGQSDTPSDPARYTMEHCQEDILEALRQLDVQPGTAILLGYSMGGRIALYSAFSGFFRALILESASPGLADSEARLQRRTSDEALAKRIEREGIPAFVDYWEKQPLFESQQRLPEEERDAIHQQRLDNQATGLANSLRGVGIGSQPALHARLGELDLPTLLLTGKLDSKFCAIAQQMQQKLPRASWHIIPGAGHAPHLEQPERFVAQVGNFCTQVLS